MNILKEVLINNIKGLNVVQETPKSQADKKYLIEYSNENFTIYVIKNKLKKSIDIIKEGKIYKISTEIIQGKKKFELNFSTAIGILNCVNDILDNAEPILKFNSIQRDTIFQDDYIDFKKNNSIFFKSNIGTNPNIAVLYGANGTGKSSLTKLLDESIKKTKSRKVKFDFFSKDNLYNEKDKNIFHTINDQKSRGNIIPSDTNEIYLGFNVVEEEKLAEELNTLFKTMYDSLKSKLKSFGLSSSAPSLELVKGENIHNFSKAILGTKDINTLIDRAIFINEIQTFENIIIENKEEKYSLKLDFLKNNLPFIEKIENIKLMNIEKLGKFREIDENETAITILNKFSYKKDCIVCDSLIDKKEDLLSKKENNKNLIKDLLDPKIKEVLEELIEKLKNYNEDYFQIRENLTCVIETGNITFLNNLLDDIKSYKEYFAKEIKQIFYNEFSGELVSKFQKYSELRDSKVEISGEDFDLIKSFINENIDNQGKRELSVERDEKTKNLIIRFADKVLTDYEKDGFPLSTGQQNFLSLAMEFLKAKKSNKKIIVLDDPISSFDSIYKNKIAYCITKFLENKTVLILTHNIDLVTLLKFQLTDCFNLYLFNNIENGENGFIRICSKEEKILLNTRELIKLFRENIKDHINDEKLFLLSMIPFMRGYANLINFPNSKDDKTPYKQLSKVMHGYENGEIDISSIYQEIFGITFDKYLIDIDRLLETEIDNETNFILHQDSIYTLLNKTLYHNFNYLKIRIIVENTLCKLFSIEIPDGKYPSVGDIINKAFNINEGKDSEELKKEKNKYRVFFTSQKTLLNDFNHFEGNISIFQPAIDITDEALEYEKKQIFDKLKELKKFVKEEQSKIIDETQEVPCT